jgi:hypothetical protein
MTLEEARAKWREERYFLEQKIANLRRELRLVQASRKPKAKPFRKPFRKPFFRSQA